MAPRLAMPVVVAALALSGFAACGADDTPVAGTPGSTSVEATAGLTVVARDISLAPKDLRTPAGPVDVTYRNEGSIEHTLVIEGVTGFKLDVTTKGDVDEGSVTLAAGKYTMYCDIPGHRQAGMEATLTVE